MHNDQLMVIAQLVEHCIADVRARIPIHAWIFQAFFADVIKLKLKKAAMIIYKEQCKGNF